MKILIDTNVIIDILQKREPFFEESYHAYSEIARISSIILFCP